MNRIELNETTVKVQGGVRNRELYEAVCGAGYPFPGGGCPTVGPAAAPLFLVLIPSRVALDSLMDAAAYSSYVGSL